MENYLIHYGVKGMKWGVRKSGRTPAARSPSRTKRVLATNKKQVAVRRKSNKRPSQMSQDELDREIKRLELEKKVKNLRSDVKSDGQKFISEVLDKSMKNIATQAATWAIGTALNKVISKTLGKKHPSVTGGIVNPKKGQKDK